MPSWASHISRFTHHSSLITSPVAPQHSDALGELRQVRERSLDVRLVLIAYQIEIEGVLPRAAFDGSRFELRQVNVAQGEGGERAEQATGFVRYAKHNGRFPLDLVRSRPDRSRAVGPSKQKESSEILDVVFDAFRDDLCAVDRGGG